MTHTKIRFMIIGFIFIGAFATFSGCGEGQEEQAIMQEDALSSNLDINESMDLLKSAGNQQTEPPAKPLCNQTSYWCCAHLNYCACTPDANMCQVILNPSNIQ